MLVYSDILSFRLLQLAFVIFFFLLSFFVVLAKGLCIFFPNLFGKLLVYLVELLGLVFSLRYL